MTDDPKLAIGRRADSTPALSPSESIDAILEVLSEERAFIRALDGAGVERSAKIKEALASRLAAFTPSDLTPHARLLVTLRAELRRNGVLLAHARACLREAMTLARTPRLDERV